MEGTAAWSWIAAPTHPPDFWVRVILGVFFASIIPFTFILVGGWGADLFWRALTFALPNDSFSFGAALYLDLIGVPTVVIGSAFWWTPIRIDIGPNGVRVDRRFHPRTIRWENLRPSALPPHKEWGWMAGWTKASFLGPSGTMGQNFPVSRTQAIAILAHPKAPAALFPPEFWEWLDRPPRANPPIQGRRTVARASNRRTLVLALGLRPFPPRPCHAGPMSAVGVPHEPLDERDRNRLIEREIKC